MRHLFGRYTTLHSIPWPDLLPGGEDRAADRGRHQGGEGDGGGARVGGGDGGGAGVGGGDGGGAGVTED